MFQIFEEKRSGFETVLQTFGFLRNLLELALLFNLQVRVHEHWRQFAGGGFDGEGSALAQAREQQFPAMKDFLRGGDFVHLRYARGSLGGGVMQIGLPDHDEQYQMAGN